MRHALGGRGLPRLRPPTERTGPAAPVTMKPPKFDYHAPASLDEALALLRRYGGDAKVLAGGQSLMPLLNFRLSRPAALVDLNRIPSLAYIEERDGQVRFGAMTRQRTIEFSPLVARRGPPLRGDRKSTRLHSRHRPISYAVL